MRVWLVTIGEPLPIDSANERLLRTGIVAEALVARGHDVVWWTSAFNHSLKSFRANEDRSIQLGPKLRLELLYGGGYRRNISIDRIRDHRRLAARFQELAASAPPPDIIQCSFPPVELSLAAVEFGRSKGIPVILDIRDLWPDVFWDVAPRVLRPVARFATQHWTRDVRRACAGASHIWGHAPAFVEWGLEHAGRAGTSHDRVFPHAYVDWQPSDAQRREAEATWDSLGVRRDDGSTTVCFTGTIGHQFDMETVLDAAAQLRAHPIRFVMCGTGDQLDRLRQRAAGLSNCIWPGWRTRFEIWTLLRRASIGLAPYIRRTDFLATIPNKAAEYFSANLPVALSLDEGLLHGLLHEYDCGFSYAGNAAVLAEHLRRLHVDRDTLTRMSANARTLFDRRFRADIVYREMIDALETIAGASRR